MLCFLKILTCSHIVNMNTFDFSVLASIKKASYQNSTVAPYVPKTNILHNGANKWNLKGKTSLEKRPTILI
jgi:hypothetical protein